MDENDYGEDNEYPAYLVDCTCDHDPEEHGWVCCNKYGCPCEGRFEE